MLRTHSASKAVIFWDQFLGPPITHSASKQSHIHYNTGNTHTHTYTHTRLTALCLGLPRWAGTRKVKPIWILLKQETVSGSGISWAIRKFAPCSRQITTPAPHRSVFYRPDALPAAQPTASEHWRHYYSTVKHTEITHHHITNAHLKTSQAKIVHCLRIIKK